MHEKILLIYIINRIKSILKGPNSITEIEKRINYTFQNKDYLKQAFTQVIEEEKRGYKAVQLGYGKVKNSKLTKAMKGVFAKKNTEAKKKLKEFRVNDTSVYKEEKKRKKI